MNKLLIITLVCVGILVIIGATNYYLNKPESVRVNLPTQNYKSLVILGLAPSTQSREPTQYDYNTGVRLTDGQNIYALMESRDLIKQDFGKTFVIRI